ncbi:MAG: hypothetical protein WBA07_03640 [Rivularia sp. (in: cyanobacteria)]
MSSLHLNCCVSANTVENTLNITIKVYNATAEELKTLRYEIFNDQCI